jgi:hypothetical protein
VIFFAQFPVTTILAAIIVKELLLGTLVEEAVSKVIEAVFSFYTRLYIDPS